MRNVIFAMLLLLGATGAQAAGADATPAPTLLRIPLISGLSTVEAPSTWHLEESGKDLTATFSEAAGASAADGVLIIAAPNPLVRDAAAYNRQAADALLKSVKNGVITKEESTVDQNNRPAHTIWIAFKAGSKAFLGWSRTIGFVGGVVQAMAIAPMGEFAGFMKTAEPIFVSCEVDPDMARENAELLTGVGRKILSQF